MTEKNSYDDFASEEFIKRPSEFSKKTLSIAKNSADRYRHLIDQKTFLDKVKKGIKLRMMYLNDHKDIYEQVTDFKITGNKIEELFEDFSRVSDIIAKNNILLAYSMSVEKDPVPSIVTKNDEKAQSMKALSRGDINREEFDKPFGHHSLNPFEVSSKRFKEYDYDKLLMITKGVPEPKIDGKTRITEYDSRKAKQKFPVYNYLREELRDRAILVISMIRERLLEIQAKNEMKDIFSNTYEEVITYDRD